MTNTSKSGYTLKVEVEQRRLRYNTNMAERKMPRPLVFLSDDERTAYLRNRCEQAKLGSTIRHYATENKSFKRDMSQLESKIMAQKQRFEDSVARSRAPGALEGIHVPSVVVQPIQDGDKSLLAIYTKPSGTTDSDSGELVQNATQLHSRLKQSIENKTVRRDSLPSISESISTSQPNLSVQHMQDQIAQRRNSSGSDASDRMDNYINTHNKATFSTGSFIQTANTSERPTIGPRTTSVPINCKSVFMKMKNEKLDDIPDDEVFRVNDIKANEYKRGQSAFVRRSASDVSTVESNCSQHTRLHRCKTAPPGGHETNHGRERRPSFFDRNKAAYLLRQELKKPKQRIVAKKQTIDLDHEKKVERARFEYYENKVATFTKSLLAMKKQSVDKWNVKEVEDKLKIE